MNLLFSSIALVGGPANQVPSDADAATLEQYRVKLEADLNAATDRTYALAFMSDTLAASLAFQRSAVPTHGEGYARRLAIGTRSAKDRKVWRKVWRRKL